MFMSEVRYFHIFLTPKDKSIDLEVQFGVNEDTVKKIAHAYNTNNPFHFMGRTFRQEQIENICIFSSKVDDGEDILLPDGRKATQIQDKADFEYVLRCFHLGKSKPIAYYANDEFLQVGEADDIGIKTTSQNISMNTKIFIVHGRDEPSAALLQGHLIKKGIDAEMFEDFKQRITGNTTVIEELMKIKDEVSYALIIATADDKGAVAAAVDSV
jgi:hypothetical protein